MLIQVRGDDLFVGILLWETGQMIDFIPLDRRSRFIALTSDLHREGVTYGYYPY